LPAKKKAAKKRAAQKEGYRFPSTKKPRTKSEITRVIAEATDVPRKSVANVMEALTAMIGQDLAKVGLFSLPGVAKMTVVNKPATRARKGINPFTGEPTIFKAKPRRKLVKLRALKALKDAVA